jgi:hypothetical protein
MGREHGPVSAVGLIAFAALVAYVAIRRHDIQRHSVEPVRGHRTAPARVGRAQPAEG